MSLPVSSLDNPEEIEIDRLLRELGIELPAIATNGFQRKPGRMEFLRARLWSENGELKAEALARQGSHQIGTLRHTNGFIRIGEHSSGFAAGERVSALPLF